LVSLHANSIAGAPYNNKFESSETPTTTRTVMSTAVSTARVFFTFKLLVYCRSNDDDRTRKVFRSRRIISSDVRASRSRIAADRLFSAHFR